MRSPETRFGIKPTGSWLPIVFLPTLTLARHSTASKENGPKKNINGLPGRLKPNTRGGLSTEERQNCPD
jgi:hypothetical protein